MDEEEAAPNKSSGSDSRSFAQALLGGGGITDEEGSDLLENLLEAIAFPAEVINVVVVAANGPKEFI